MKTRLFCLLSLAFLVHSSLADSYTLTIPAGSCRLIANQLDKPGGNTLANLMPSLPCDARLMKYHNVSNTWITTTYSTTCGWANGAITLDPGEGAFLCSCCATNFNITFTGTQRVPVLPVNVPAGRCYLLSRQIPSPGNPDNITGMTFVGGETAYTWNGGYTAHMFDELDLIWYPSTPTTAVGEAMWIAVSGATLPTTPDVPCPTNTCMTNYSITVRNCCTLIANQLNHPGGNTLANIMPSLPCDARFMKWDNANQTWIRTTYSTATGWANGAITLDPGEGAFLCPCEPCANGFTITFTGTVPPAPPPPYPWPVVQQPGYWYLLSRPFPGPGTYDNITGTSPVPGESAFTWNDVLCVYTAYQFDPDDLTWYPLNPTTTIGTAMWVHSPGVSGNPPEKLTLAEFPCPTNCVTNYTITIQGCSCPIANELNHPAGNTLANIIPTLPCDAYFMKWDNASQTWITTTYSTLTHWANGSITLGPGEGAYLCPCDCTNFNLSFTGCPPAPYTVVMDPGKWYLLSRQFPGPGTYANVTGGSSPVPNEMAYTCAGGYTAYTFDPDDLTWTPSDPLPIAVGGALWVRMPGAPGFPQFPDVHCPTNCLPPPIGMTAWWPFDELNGPIANDIAGLFNNQGAWFNSPTPIVGMVSNALCFDGINDFVLVTNHWEINFTGACNEGTNAQSFTIDAWIRANANVSYTQTLLDKRVNLGGTPRGYHLYLYDGRLGCQIADGTSYFNHNSATPDLRDGQWHFIAVTVGRCTNNANLTTMYVDGAPVYSGPDYVLGDLNNSADLLIGRHASGGGYYSGCLDELEFFKRVLSTNEIYSIFAAGPFGKCKTNCAEGLTLICATNKAVYCPANWTFDAPTVIDPCCPNNNYQLTFNTVTQSTNCPWVYLRTWTVVDCLNRTAVCSQVVTVMDTNPPVWTYYVTNKFVECGQAWSFDQPTAWDECCGTNLTIWLVSSNILYQNPPCEAVYQATWNAMDCCSNTTTWKQTVMVRDTTPPDLACATNKTVECGSAWTFDWPSVSDVCCGTNVTVWLASSNFVSGNPPCWALYRGVWNARDCCSNVTTCTQLVTVVDTQAPILNCASNKTVECNRQWSFDLPGAYDLCCGTNVFVWLASSNLISGKPPCEAVWQAIWNGRDCCGNEATCTQMVTVVDTQPPIVTTICVTNVFIIGGPNGQPPQPSTGLVLRLGNLITNFGNCAIDRYRAHTFSNLPPCITRATLTTRIKACGGTCWNDTINLSFTDPAGLLIGGAWERHLGCYTGQPDGLMPDDWCNYTTGHVFTVELGALPLANGGSSDLLPYLNQFGFLDFICQDDSGVDYVELTVTCCQCATNKVVECGTAWSFDVPTAWDLCCGANVFVTEVSTVTNGRCPWEITRVWKLTDCCTNSTHCCQVVTVVDTKPPLLTCPANKTVQSGSAWNFDWPSAYDECCGTNLTLIALQPQTNGNCCTQLISQVWLATDCCTNSSTCTQTVTVVDLSAPVITSCPANLTILAYGSQCVTNIPDLRSQVVATDNCLPLTIMQSPMGGLVGSGTYTLTFIVCDACGNCSTCTNLLTVQCTNPCVQPPPNMTAWWPFDETNSPTADDIAGAVNNQGTHYGYLFHTIVGMVSNAVCFDGTNEFILVTNQAEINFMGSCTNATNVESFTIDAWIRANTNGPAFQPLVDKRVNPDSSAPRGYHLYLFNGCLGFQIADGSTWFNHNSTAPDLRDGRWHFITLTVARCGPNGNLVTLYVDGVPKYSAVDPLTGDLNNAADLLIAKSASSLYSYSFYWGCLDELEFFKRVLTEQEIRAIYLAGSAGKCKTNCLEALNLICATNKFFPCPTNWNFDDPIVSDPCCGNNYLLTFNDTSGSFGCTNVFTRTWQVTDCLNRTATCSQTVIVLNPEPPVLTCAGDKTVASGVPWTFDPPGVEAPCCTNNLTLIAFPPQTNGNCCTQIISQVWQATCCSNTATCTQTVTVVCTTPPTITCAGNKTVACGVTWNFDPPRVSAVCCSSNDFVLVVLSTSVTNIAPCTNVHTRTWRATDGCGHFATCSQSVTVATPRPTAVKISIYCDSAGAHITFPTEPCYLYSVMYTEALSDHPTWTVLADVIGDGLTHDVLDPGPLKKARFYRLRAVCR